MENLNTFVRKAKTRSIATTLILSLALLLVLNLLSSYIFYQIDLSKGKTHTLSKTSKNLVRNLKDNVVIKVYLSKDLPPDYNVLARYAKDLLSSYKLYGRTHFRYEYVNQTNEDEFRAQAARDNIFAQRVMILENDQQTIREIYMGMAFEYKGNRESLNLTKDIEGRLEYEVTSLLRRLTKASLPKVTVFEDSLYNADYYKYFEHHINQNYDILPTNLNAPIKASDVLVFIGVVDSLSKIQLYNLDQYIMHGGNVIFLQDRVAGLVQYGRAEEIHSNLFRLLEHYGIDIKPNLVLDQNCAPINMSQRSGVFVIDVPVQYPPIPIVQGEKTSAVSKGLSDIILYLCSQIDTSKPARNVTITPILKTSPNSGIQQGPDFDIDPSRFIEQKLMSTLTLPPVTVAALYSGNFTSFYAGDPNISKTTGFIGKTDKSQIIVVSDSDLIRDFVASASSSNIMLVLNAIDFLLKDISLSEVRARMLPNSPLDISRWLYKMDISPDRIARIEPQVKQAVKAINIILPTLLLILFGFRRMFVLKRYRQYIMNRFRLEEPEEEEEIGDEPEVEDTEAKEEQELQQEDKEQ
jgi:ABC-2 type transport system permease protein